VSVIVLTSAAGQLQPRAFAKDQAAAAAKSSEAMKAWGMGPPLQQQITA